MFDIYPDFQKDVAFIPYMREKLVEYDDFFTHNPLHSSNGKCGNLTREDAISYAVTGPAGRGSILVRRTHSQALLAL